jgi:hypothetical protein
MAIEMLLQRLTTAGVQGVGEFERKLVSNAREQKVVEDILAEGTAALMFAAAGFRVQMRDRPDLALCADGQEIGAEVMHFRHKAQDAVDELRMRAADECLVEYGDTVPLEGKAAWEQVVAVALKKARRLEPDRPHLLVIQSSSNNCVDDFAVQLAVNMLNGASFRATHPEISRLNALVLMARDFHLNLRRSVYFFDLHAPVIELLPEVREAVAPIRSWTN